jgi:hypothetical protein
MKCLVRDGPDRDDERKREGERTLLGGNKYAHTHAYLIVGRRRRRRRPVVVSRRNGNSKRKGKFISFHFIFTSLGRIKKSESSSFVCDGTSRVGTELHRRLWCERRRIRSSTASTRNGNRREKRREIINRIASSESAPVGWLDN